MPKNRKTYTHEASQNANAKEAPRTLTSSPSLADGANACNDNSTGDNASPDSQKELRITIPTNPVAHKVPTSPPGTEGPPTHTPATPNTALNVFKFALGTLSAASGNIPVPGVKLAIDSLLAITNYIQVRLIYHQQVHTLTIV